MATERTKNFMFVVYPDNKHMVENWREVIKDYGHKAFISPIHDKDTYEKDIKNDNGEILHKKGEFKKAHYHVCVCRSTPTTVNSIVKYFVKMSVDFDKNDIEYVRESIVAVYRYFSHDGKPNKAQYNANEIEKINGFELFDYEQPTRTNSMRAGIEVMKLIKEYSFCSLLELMLYLSGQEQYILWEYCQNHAYLINQWIYANNKYNNNEQKK